MHIYAFGSVCRGDVDPLSDIDLLAIVDSYDKRFDQQQYSIYSYRRIGELWDEGNPFSWHLYTEAVMLFSSDRSNYLQSLGQPSVYKSCTIDCNKFYKLCCISIDNVMQAQHSIVFELSTIFLSVRNFACCFLLGQKNEAVFSRHSALKMGNQSLTISKEIYRLLEESRILSIRGKGESVQINELDILFAELLKIKRWMENLLQEV